MKVKKIRKWYLIPVVILVIVLGLFSLKNYSDRLIKEGKDELFNTKNRPLALSKFRLAATLWPLLSIDKSYLFSDDQLKTLEQRSAVNIFLKENTGSDDVNILLSELRAVKGVGNVKFISQQDAFEKYKEKNKESPILRELIAPNFLPQSIEVYLDDFTVRNLVEKVARNKSFVEVVVQSI